MARAKANTKKWLKIAAAIAAGVLVVGAIVGLSVKLDRQTTTVRVGTESYSVGVLNEKGEVKDKNTAIIMEKSVNADGLSCTLAENAKITYQIFFYDKDDEFISATDTLTTNYDGSETPSNAKYVRIMITPTADEDGKVGFFEKGEYAKQLTVRVNKD